MECRLRRSTDWATIRSLERHCLMLDRRAWVMLWACLSPCDARVTFWIQAYVPIRSVQTSRKSLTLFYVPIRSWKPSLHFGSFYSMIHTFPHVPGNPLAHVLNSVCWAYVPVRSVFVPHTFLDTFATSSLLIIPSIHVPCNPLASSWRKQSWRESIDQNKEEGFPAQAHIYIYIYIYIYPYRCGAALKG